MKAAVLDPRLVADMLAYLGRGRTPGAAPGAVMLGATRTGLAAELRSYGEDAVAASVEAAPDDIIWKISTRAGQLIFSSGENIPQSLCLSGVEVIEGKHRPLARKRRRRAT